MKKWKRIALELQATLDRCSDDMDAAREALQKGMGDDRSAALPALARQARDVLLIQSAELVRLRQEMRAAREDTVAPLRALLGGAVSRLSPKAVSGQTVLLINDLRAEITSLRQQAATDRKLAGEAADEAARLQRELEGLRGELETVRKQADAAIRQSGVFGDERREALGRAEAAEGEVSQERRRRERAEAERDALSAERQRASEWNRLCLDCQKPIREHRCPRHNQSSADRADHLRKVLIDVNLPGKAFFVGAMGHGHYLQIVYHQPCVESGENKEQHGRKWYLSPHATDAEVVLTVLKAALTSGEHEVREHFTYKGARVFGPHFDLDVLVALCQQGATQTRGA